MPTRFSPLPPELLPEIPGYHVHARVGRGSYGTVYKASPIEAYRQGIPLHVALKVLHEVRTETPAELESRDRREIDAACQLQHPNVVPLTRFLHVDDPAGGCGQRLVLEFAFMPCSLADRLRERIHPAEAVRIARDAARGLAAAHGKGIVHRDIAPGNLFIDPAGQVRVGDFGLAASVLENPEAVARKRWQYDPPEADLAPDRARRASDVYSLGVVLFEMLAGRLPFRKREERILSRPRLPRSARARVAWAVGGSRKLLEILDRCLAVRAPDRFRDAAQLSLALEEIELGAEVADFPPRGLASESRRLLLEFAFGCLMRGRVLVLVAGPGSGKCELVEGFKAGLPGRLPIRIEKTLRATGTLPLAPIHDLVSELASSPGARQAFDRLAPTWLSLARGDPFEIPPAFLPGEGDQGPHRLRQLVDALEAVTFSIGPLLWILHGSEWLDSFSSRVLQALAAPCARWRGLVLLVPSGEPGSAPRRESRVLRRGKIRTLAIERLDAPGVGRLLEERYGANRVEPAFDAALVSWTSGYRSAIAKILDELERKHFIELRDGIWRLVQPIEWIEKDVAGELDESLSARLDAIGGDDLDRELVDSASVEGPEFTARIQAELHGRPAPEIRKRSDAIARRSRLFTPAFQDGEEVYRFSRPSWHRAIYEDVDEEARMCWHRRIGTILRERSQAGEAPVDAAVWHLVRGRDPSSVPLAAGAARRMNRVGAHEQAAQLCQDALENGGRGTPEGTARLRLELGRAHEALGRWERAEAEYALALEAVGGAEAALAAEIHLSRATVHRLQGRSGVREELRKVVALADRLPRPGVLSVLSRLEVARHGVGSGSYAEALSHLREGYAIYKRLGPPEKDVLNEVIVVVAVAVADLRVRLGEPPDPDQTEACLVANLSRLEGTPAAAEIRCHYGTVLRRRRQFDEARRFLEKSRESFLSAHNFFGLARVENELGIVSFHEEKWREALAHFETSLSYKIRLENRPGLAITHHCLGAVRRAMAAEAQLPDLAARERRLGSWHINESLRLATPALNQAEVARVRQTFLSLARDMAPPATAPLDPIEVLWPDRSVHALCDPGDVLLLGSAADPPLKGQGILPLSGALLAGASGWTLVLPDPDAAAEVQGQKAQGVVVLSDLPARIRIGDASLRVTRG